MVNGKVRIDTAEAFRFGKMVPAMKVIGALIRLTVKEPSGTYMVTSTKASGSTIRLMATAHTLMQTVPNTRATGKTTCNMVSVLKNGPMAQGMKVSMFRDASMAGAPTLGKMDLSTRETGTRTKSMAVARTCG